MVPKIFIGVILISQYLANCPHRLMKFYQQSCTSAIRLHYVLSIRFFDRYALLSSLKHFVLYTNLISGLWLLRSLIRLSSLSRLSLLLCLIVRNDLSVFHPSVPGFLTGMFIPGTSHYYSMPTYVPICARSLASYFVLFSCQLFPCFLVLSPFSVLCFYSLQFLVPMMSYMSSLLTVHILMSAFISVSNIALQLAVIVAPTPSATTAQRFFISSRGLCFAENDCRFACYQSSYPSLHSLSPLRFFFRSIRPLFCITSQLPFLTISLPLQTQSRMDFSLSMALILVFLTRCTALMCLCSLHNLMLSPPVFFLFFVLFQSSFQPRVSCIRCVVVISSFLESNNICHVKLRGHRIRHSH